MPPSSAPNLLLLVHERLVSAARLLHRQNPNSMNINLHAEQMYPHSTYPESDTSRGRVFRLELHSISLLWGGIIVIESPPDFHIQNAWFVHSIGQVFQDNTIYQVIIILLKGRYCPTLASKFRHKIWRLSAAEQDPVVRPRRIVFLLGKRV